MIQYIRKLTTTHIEGAATRHELLLSTDASNRCACLNGLQQGQVVALCKSEETLRKFLQDKAYEEGEEGEVLVYLPAPLAAERLSLLPTPCEREHISSIQGGEM